MLKVENNNNFYFINERFYEIAINALPPRFLKWSCGNDVLRF